jgi:uncharacterized protein with HEPN domain
LTREFLDYIEDVIDTMNKAERFVEGMEYESFLADDKTAFAVVRALEVIGEAVKKVPAEIRSRYIGIPWIEMAGMRDKLIHEYFGVNLRIVWDTLKKDVPRLKPEFEQMYEELLRDEP